MIVIVPFIYSDYLKLQRDNKNPHILNGFQWLNYIKRVKGNYSNLLSDGNYYSDRGKTEGNKESVLKIAYNDKNGVIIDGRLVNDYTFATRLKYILTKIYNQLYYDKEDLEYFIKVADRLLKLQTDTAIDPNEIDYLKRTKDLFP